MRKRRERRLRTESGQQAMGRPDMLGEVGAEAAGPDQEKTVVSIVRGDPRLGGPLTLVTSGMATSVSTR